MVDVRLLGMKKPKKLSSAIIDPLAHHKAKRAASETAKVNKNLLKRLEVAEERAGVAEALKASARTPRPISSRKLVQNLHKRVATPVFLVSDLHVEETVDPKTVGGVNVYSPEIADRRLERLGNAMCWMVDHHRKSFEIREAVLWLGGDLLSGYIHEELKEVVALSPVQTLLWLQERIECLIGKLLGVPGLELLKVVCSVGNHGRTTPKLQIATVTANSYEWLLYHQLRRTFASNNRVQFDIADGDFLRVQIHKTKVGFHHGHLARYGGGVGGIMIPLMKAVAKWDTYGPCDVWNFGHFHQLWDTPRIVVNGSLIGTTPYGMAVGSFEVPAQASYLIDSKRGKCMSTTLWVESSDHGQKR